MDETPARGVADGDIPPGRIEPDEEDGMADGKKQAMDFDEASLMFHETLSDDMPSGTRLALLLSLALDRLTVYDAGAEAYVVDWDKPLAGTTTAELDALVGEVVAAGAGRKG